MHVKIRQLAHALALSRYGSFRRAAEAEHISQPALSRSIQSLEDSLGVVLFDRHSAEITPTAYGEALLERAGTILAEAKELEREMVLLQGLDLGRLSLGMGLFSAELSGDPALADLLTAHPKLKISVRLRYWTELENAVERREVDLAFGEVGHLRNSPGLLVEPVGRHELLFFCRPGHSILSRKSISVSDLDAFPLVCPPVRAADAKFFPRNLQVDESGVYAFPPIQVEELTAMRAIVAGTDAISFATPVQLEHLLQRDEVAAIPFRASWLRLDYGFFYLASRSLSPAAEAFMTRVRRIERDLAERNRLLVEEIFEDQRTRLESAG